MSNYILKYSRGERVKYVSHLDFVRVFHRAVRRSGIPFVFSQGFNPHPVMTVAMPLSVGVTADGELMKVGFDGEFDIDNIKNKLNEALPIGFKIEKVYKLNQKEIDITKIDKAEYRVFIESNKELNSSDIISFMKNEEISVMKRSKSGTSEKNIKDYIYSLTPLNYEDGTQEFIMCLACGNAFNLKPDTVVSAMEKYIDGYIPNYICVHRNKLLCGDKEIF